jgi:hypothetical protein
MLVDQQYSYVLSLLCKSCESFFNLARLSLLIHDQEVSLRIWRFRDMTDASEEQACNGTVLCQPRTGHQVPIAEV